MPIFGMPVVESPFMVIKTQIKRHRKKRINKKWAKKYGFCFKPMPDVYISAGRIIGHPLTISKILTHMRGGPT
jgi:hypothetical protein